MIRFKKKAVLLMGCLFVISFSQGCTSFGSSSQSSVGGVILKIRTDKQLLKKLSKVIKSWPTQLQKEKRL